MNIDGLHGRGHNGFDLPTIDRNFNLVAPIGGTITYLPMNKPSSIEGLDKRSYGNRMVIKEPSPSKRIWVFNHLEGRVDGIRDGAVEAGTPIGIMGDTPKGNNYPVHLHLSLFELDASGAIKEVLPVNQYMGFGDPANGFINQNPAHR